MNKFWPLTTSMTFNSCPQSAKYGPFPLLVAQIINNGIYSLCFAVLHIFLTLTRTWGIWVCSKPQIHFLLAQSLNRVSCRRIRHYSLTRALTSLIWVWRRRRLWPWCSRREQTQAGCSSVPAWPLSYRCFALGRDGSRKKVPTRSVKLESVSGNVAIECTRI